MARPAAGSSPQPPRAARIRWGAAIPLIALVVLVLCVSAISILAKWSGIFRSGESAALSSAQVGSQNPAMNPPLPTGQMKILLLGSDQRPDDGGYRTDVIILVVVDPDQMTVSAVSFPRDLWVKVPGLYEMKINQVQALGGFDATAAMFQENFGVKPDYYVMTNFAGFTQFIDKQGGVDVEVGQELTDDCDLPQEVNGDCTIAPGVVHMDGGTALWYVRSRNTSSDYDRLRRAQEVLYAVLKKMINFGTLAKLSEIKAELESNVETNLSISKAVSLLPVAARVLQSPDRIRRFSITEDQATPSWSWDGMWILLPDAGAIRGLLQEAGIKP
jgi:LCP family protein required for cell wall assembly